MYTTEQPSSPPSERAPGCASRSLSHVNGQPIAVSRQGSTLLAGPAHMQGRSRWLLQEAQGSMTLTWQSAAAQPLETDDQWAAIEAAFQFMAHHDEVRVIGTAGTDRPGLLVHRSELWQMPQLWLPSARQPMPLRHALSGGMRHPIRPSKPEGVVYRRQIPWLDKTLSLRTVDMPLDLPVFNRWMNDPVVSHFWQEQGDMAQHRAYLDRIEADPHVIGLIGCFDGEPFGYFEVYWAKEDRIAPFCEADDHDRGWHVLVGEARFRGRPFLTAWMPSISHYLFLDDCRTQRVVIEPRVDNHKILKSLSRCGYALVKEFDFPHKRAMLGTLHRETLFNDHSWQTGDKGPREGHPFNSRLVRAAGDA